VREKEDPEEPEFQPRINTDGHGFPEEDEEILTPDSADYADFPLSSSAGNP
jgi:hypothetical protein